MNYVYEKFYNATPWLTLPVIWNFVQKKLECFSQANTFALAFICHARVAPLGVEHKEVLQLKKDSLALNIRRAWKRKTL